MCRRRRKERPKERAALRQQRRFECALSGSLCGLQLHFGKTKRADLLLAKTLKDRATSQVRAPVVALGPVHHNCKQKRAKKLFLYISICSTTTTATTTRKVANQKWYVLLYPLLVAYSDFWWSPSYPKGGLSK